MDKYGLVSNYTIKQFKVHRTSCNEEKIENKVDRKFNDREYLEVVISDLTYVRVRDKWCCRLPRKTQKIDKQNTKKFTLSKKKSLLTANQEALIMI